MSNPIYDDLENADGNDLISELNHLRKVLVEGSKLPFADNLLGDFENITAELTLRENQ
jgi:hypothetical protein